MVNRGRGKARMTNGFQVFVDSDAFVGWMVEKDAHHSRANQIFSQLHKKQARMVTNTMVVTETATVLSHHSGQELARTFLDEVIDRGQFPVIPVVEDLYKETLTIFKKQTKKGTSVTDCANVAVIRRLDIPTIFSFDQVYPKNFHLKVAE